MLSSLFKQFKTNADREINGIEVKYDANADGSQPTFIIARIGAANRAYMKTLDRNLRPHRREVQLGTLDIETDYKLTLDTFVDEILKGWSHVLNEDGSPLMYNRTNAIALMKLLPDLYIDLRSRASEAANYRDAELEGEAKNS